MTDYRFFIPVILLEAALMIISIIKFRMNSNIKHWNWFIGVHIASLVGIMIAVVSLFFIDGGLNELFEGALMLALPLFLIVAISISGSFATSKIPKENKRLRATGALICGIGVLVNVLAIIVLPMFAEASNQSQIATKTIELITKKYGDQDYKVENVKKDYTDSGIISSRHTGYEIRISAQGLDQDFTMRLHGTSPEKIRVFSDNFAETYYEDKLAERFGDNGKITTLFFIDYRDISDDYGHFPSLEELESLGAVDYAYFEILGRIDNYERFDNYFTRLDNVKSFAAELGDYLEVKEHVGVELQRHRKNGSYSYDIEITGSEIKLTDDNNREYVYDRSTLEEISE